MKNEMETKQDRTEQSVATNEPFMRSKYENEGRRQLNINEK